MLINLICNNAETSKAGSMQQSIELTCARCDRAVHFDFATVNGLGEPNWKERLLESVRSVFVQVYQSYGSISSAHRFTAMHCPRCGLPSVSIWNIDVDSPEDSANNFKLAETYSLASWRQLCTDYFAHFHDHYWNGQGQWSDEANRLDLEKRLEYVAIEMISNFSDSIFKVTPSEQSLSMATFVRAINTDPDVALDLYTRTVFERHFERGAYYFGRRLKDQTRGELLVSGGRSLIDENGMLTVSR